MESCEAEINKIKVLLTDLLDSVEAIKKEKNQVEEILNILDSKIFDIDLKLEKEVGFKLQQILDQINSANEKKSYIIGIKLKEAQNLKYIAQKEKLENVLSAAKEGNEFEPLSTANMTVLSKTLEKILKEIKYPDLTAVSYSEENSDFVISGEDRALFGKGYRAIVYASFIVAIQHLLFDKPYSIGIPVIDSPLVTYKKADISEEDLIPVDLAQDYYRYIAKDKLLNQIIIIENVEPPSDILDEIYHVSFTRSDTIGRYGFFPKI
jgi:rRNA maturation endonuclease Nob1